MKNKINVLTIGGAAQDIFLNYENPEIKTIEQKSYILLEEGSKIDIKRLHYYTGGGSINSACSFKRLECNVSTFCKLGNDSQGQFILNELNKENISTENIVYSDNLQTAISFVISPPGRDRVILAHRGANIDLKKEEIPVQKIKQVDQLYITSLSGNSAKLLLPITELAKQNNIPVAVNPGMNQIKSQDKLLIESLKNIDTLILNATESQQLMLSLLSQSTSRHLIPEPETVRPETVHPECFCESKNVSKDSGKLFSSFLGYKNNNLTIKDYFKAILQKGPSIIVVTNGAEGVYIADKEFMYFHKSIPPKQLVNTLGAGDSFGSCFVAALLHKKTIEEALFYGIINASSVISHEGAKTGLLTWAQITEKAAQEAYKMDIEKFKI